MAKTLVILKPPAPILLDHMIVHATMDSPATAFPALTLMNVVSITRARLTHHVLILSAHTHVNVTVATPVTVSIALMSTSAPLIYIIAMPMHLVQTMTVVSLAHAQMAQKVMVSCVPMSMSVHVPPTIAR